MKQIVFSMVAIIVLFFGPANAEMVKIPWHTSTQSSPWIPGDAYIDGWSKNFMNGTVEENGKVRAEGELQAEMMRPHGTKGPIPFVLMLHGCSGAREWKWATDYWRKASPGRLWHLGARQLYYARSGARRCLFRSKSTKLGAASGR